MSDSSPRDTDQVGGFIAARHADYRKVSESPFGADDEIGMLNLMTPASRARILAEADAARPFDLAVDYFVGMPSWVQAGDPAFQIWMSHTPAGTVVEDPMGVGREQNHLVGYSGDCIAMYTHCGTHIDALNHFGYCGEIWNGFTEREHLGSRQWSVCGAEKQPPIIARGVLIDVAGAHETELLPDSHGIGEDDLRMALDRQGTTVRPGDVVAIRTGRMTVWPDPEKYVLNEPGLNREGAEFLAKAGAMVIGADNVALEQAPAADPENWQVVHTYLFAEAGVPIMEVLNLEELAAAELYEFAFIGMPMPIRGATGAPMRPIALPLRDC
jgi:kynurenine formamidase